MSCTTSAPHATAGNEATRMDKSGGRKAKGGRRKHGAARPFQLLPQGWAGSPWGRATGPTVSVRPACRIAICYGAVFELSSVRGLELSHSLAPEGLNAHSQSLARSRVLELSNSLEGSSSRALPRARTLASWLPTFGFLASASQLQLPDLSFLALAS